MRLSSVRGAPHSRLSLGQQRGRGGRWLRPLLGVGLGSCFFLLLRGGPLSFFDISCSSCFLCTWGSVLSLCVLCKADVAARQACLIISCIIFSYPPIGGQVCMLCALHVVGLGAWGVGWVEFISGILLSCPLLIWNGSWLVLIENRYI